MLLQKKVNFRVNKKKLILLSSCKNEKFRKYLIVFGTWEHLHSFIFIINWLTSKLPTEVKLLNNFQDLVILEEAAMKNQLRVIMVILPAKVCERPVVYTISHIFLEISLIFHNPNISIISWQ